MRRRPGSSTSPMSTAWRCTSRSASGAKFVIDVGCGSGDKLKPFIEGGLRVIGIDFGANAEKFKAAVPQARFFPKNLEEGLPRVTDDVTSEAVVICSDVVEHLVEPHALLGALSALAGRVKYLSHVDAGSRAGARHRGQTGPPANRAHACANEPRRIPLARHRVRLQHRLPRPHGQHKLAQAEEQHPAHRRPPGALSPGGAQVRPGGRQRLQRGGHPAGGDQSSPGPGRARDVFDNWSTDGSWEYAAEQAKKGAGVTVQRFPDRPTDQFEWSEHHAECRALQPQRPP